MKTAAMCGFLSVTLLLSATPCEAQQVFNVWLNQRIDTLLQKAQVLENGKGSSRQRETPSGDDRSTSLVDQSSTTDFVSTAIQFIPVSNISGLAAGQQSGSMADASRQGSGSGSVTVTGYSLLAALSKRSLTDPQFYKEHTNARRLSLTLGTAASATATDGTDKAGMVFGLKYVVINGRDLYSKTGIAAVQIVQAATTVAALNDAQLSLDVKKLIFEACQPSPPCALGRTPPSDYNTEFAHFWLTHNDMSTLSLPDWLQKQVDDRIQKALQHYQTYQTKLNEAYDRVRSGRQLAISYQVVKRPDNGNNDHRAEASFDYGLTDRITWTWNASFDYKDRKQLAASRGGRIATEFKGNLTRESRDPLGRAPVTLSFSGEAKWLEMTKPQYTFQAKLSIPLGTGLDFPIAYRFANRRAQIGQNDSEARLGLTVDVGRLVQLLK